jgi:hypothetical protein
MATQLGIFNPNSKYNRSLREAVDAPAPIRMTVTFSDLETWAFYFAAMYRLALDKDNGVLIREREAQLKALADYADWIV